MPLTKKTKVGLVEGFRVHPKDTGSPEVQVAILSERIQYMTQHLQVHRKDFSSNADFCRWSENAAACWTT